MISFKNVDVTFKERRQTVHAVKNASFDIEDGDIFGIVGGSGAGKSTLLRTINQLQKITDGDVIVNGVAVKALKHKALHELRKSIGMIFQHFNLAESKTVYENIAFSLEDAGWKKEDIEKRVDELLDFVKISDKKFVYPAKLSGGQKQRVAIARALANNTRILLCDEPTSALDAETTASVLKLIKDVNEKLGVTVVIITHELDVVKSICNKVVVMKNGEVVEKGDVYEVFTSPKNDFTKELLEHEQNFKVPEEIWNSTNGDIIKLVYKGDSATESILSEITARNNVRFNILHGKIEYISSKPLGILFVNFSGDAANIETVKLELASRIFRLEKVVA
ncbi:methionine ABC transporter ATP-binding protein [Treponema sp.]|uniref:methionine ABC transporter ATP-binding protein n=1 Tax=Treponema sp. TaxID=166 RepID=UPI0025F2C353|nr:methionine ABC transporter ATP-binding protein [Treponema sp.]MCR5217891.1 methionine ABC transporter ATP-binding protein [Treponema sp.]